MRNKGNEMLTKPQAWWRRGSERKGTVAGITKKVLPGLDALSDGRVRVLSMGHPLRCWIRSRESTSLTHTIQPTTYKHNDDQKDSWRGEDVPRE